MKLVEAILSEKIKVTERWGVSDSDVWLRDSTKDCWTGRESIGNPPLLWHFIACVASFF